jgi:transposase-like protein
MTCPSCGSGGAVARLSPGQLVAAKRDGHRVANYLQGGHPVAALIVFGCRLLGTFLQARYRCPKCGRTFR